MLGDMKKDIFIVTITTQAMKRKFDYVRSFLQPLKTATCVVDNLRKFFLQVECILCASPLRWMIFDIIRLRRRIVLIKYHSILMFDQFPVQYRGVKSWNPKSWCGGSRGTSGSVNDCFGFSEASSRRQHRAVRGPDVVRSDSRSCQWEFGDRC